MGKLLNILYIFLHPFHELPDNRHPAIRPENILLGQVMVFMGKNIPLIHQIGKIAGKFFIDYPCPAPED